MRSQPLSLSNILWSRPARGTQSHLPSFLPLSPTWPSQVLAVQAWGRVWTVVLKSMGPPCCWSLAWHLASAVWSGRIRR